MSRKTSPPGLMAPVNISGISFNIGQGDAPTNDGPPADHTSRRGRLNAGAF